jgi:hypothetical protein
MKLTYDFASQVALVTGASVVWANLKRLRPLFYGSAALQPASWSVRLLK